MDEPDQNVPFRSGCGNLDRRLQCHRAPQLIGIDSQNLSYPAFAGNLNDFIPVLTLSRPVTANPHQGLRQKPTGLALKLFFRIGTYQLSVMSKRWSIGIENDNFIHCVLNGSN